MVEKIIICLLFAFGIYYLTSDINDYGHYVILLVKKIKWVFIFLAALYLLLWVNFRFLFERIFHVNTFFHELSHTVAVFFTGGRVLSFNVNHDTSGNIISQSKLKAFVFLAPYTFPWMPLLVFAIYYFADGGLKNVMFYLFCFSYANYFFRIFRETRFYQVDLKSVGLVWSSLIILLSNIFFLLFFANGMK